MSEVAVLLPLRIETAFDPLPGGGWQLRVILVPDTPWIDKHDPGVAAAELDEVDAFWQATEGDIGHAHASAAFHRLAATLGAARAAWLLRSFPAVAGADGYRVDRNGFVERTAPRMNLIRPLPRTIQLWAASDDVAPLFTLLHEFHPTDQALRVDLREDAPVAEAGEKVFMPSWSEAETAGLTCTINLEIDPADIGVLYAVGADDQDPMALFKAHRDAGQLSLLATGDPTNTVAGAAAADLGQDPARWLAMLQGAADGGDTAALGYALGGIDHGLAPIPAPPLREGGQREGADKLSVLGHHERGPLLVGALWPALWQANLKDIWGIDPSDTDGPLRLGLWASRWLHPEGPYPPIRIGQQPYGVLPATSLQHWDASPDNLQVEADLAHHLQRARAFWIEIAKAKGNIEGAGAERVLELLEQLPISARLMASLFVPLEIAQQGLLGKAAPQEVAAWWRDQAAQALALRNGEAERAFVQFFAQFDVPMALVEPERPAHAVPWLQGDGDAPSLFARAVLWYLETFQRSASNLYYEVFLRDDLEPRSLLFRLIVLSAMVAASEIRRHDNGISGPVAPSEGRLSQRMDPGAQIGELDNTPAGEVFVVFWKALERLAFEDTRVLERSLLATLDCASHRLDAWITGLATRRLSSAAYANMPRAQGAYGWVDRPFRGERGPTQAGALLAPSLAQARTAVVLRDKAIHDPAPAAGALPGTRRWDLDLDSRSVRMAQRLAKEVRAGAHLGEALGREIERFIANAQSIRALRHAFPLHQANGARRTCDGDKLIRLSTADVEAVLGHPLSAGQQMQWQGLAKAVDAYSDLLVANAVHDVVSGHAEEAAATLEAAAGLGLPPSLDVIRTPRLGRAAATQLVMVLPSDPPAAGDSPVAMAEPAFAAFIARRTPPARDLDWVRVDATVDGDITTVVTLEQLGLQPIDLIALSSDQVSALVIAASSGPVVTPRVLAKGSGPRWHARLLRLAAAFAGRPPLPSELTIGKTTTVADEPMRTELLGRLQSLHAAAQSLRDDLQAAPADEASRQALLLGAVRWGIAPSPSPGADQDSASLADRIARAAQVIDERLHATEGDLSQWPAERIAEAIRQLATGGKTMPVMARVQRAQIAATAGGASAMSPEPNQTVASHTRPRLDRQWLGTVAAVRAAAARIDAMQLEANMLGSPVLSAWSNRPGDPWQASITQAQADALQSTTLVAAYGEAGTLDVADGDNVAVALVDSWSETVPSIQHTATAAVGFNAPASRPPQAILIAVSPVQGEALDDAMLRDIVAETRLNAHARAVNWTDLQALATALPLTMMSARFGDKAGLKLFDWEVAAP